MFEENVGQVDSRIGFISRGPGYTLFLTNTEAILGLQKPAREPVRIAPAGQLITASEKPIPRPWQENSAFLRIRLLRRNRVTSLKGTGLLPQRTNYFIGNNPARWRENVPVYRSVIDRSVYAGVDLVYHGKSGRLELDFVIAPRAGPERICIAMDGTKGMRLTENGDLAVEIAGREVRFHRPVAYQEAEGTRREVPVSYLLRGKDRATLTVGFAIGSYDKLRPLIIDPVLSYSTYLGGTGDDVGMGVAADSAGNAYVTGYTFSANFPTLGPAQRLIGGSFDAFVTKFAPGGAIVYSTYIGGSGGDVARGIAVDSGGNVYITGYTSSTDFPTVNSMQRSFAGGASDAFVSKLSADGSTILYSTYLGGGSSDRGYSIAVDSAGSAYVTGLTASTNFPVVGPLQGSLNGSQDAFVAKLNPSGSALAYSTYLGGKGVDVGNGIALDADANCYVVGATNSPDFPLVNALQTAYGGGIQDGDAFVVKVNAQGSALLYSTYLGGSGDDSGNGIAVDISGNAYLTGGTGSSNFPTVNPLQGLTGGPCPAAGNCNPSAFVAKLNATGTALLYSTYLSGAHSPGTSFGDTGSKIALDSAANAYITGQTTSNSFPISNAWQPNYGGGSTYGDAFVTKLNSDGSALLFSSYLGGAGDDAGAGIATDSNGNVYVTGYTSSANFPTALPIQRQFGGGNFDVFVAKISVPSIPPFVNAVSNGASFALAQAVAAGSIVSIFGSNLATSTATAATTPLPTSLGGTTVIISGGGQSFQAALYYVSPLQINLQAPWEVAGLSQVSVMVSANGVTGNNSTVHLANAGPGIFQIGSGMGAILISNSTDLAQPVGAVQGRTSRPASRGGFISIFCTGLGGLTSAVPSDGVPAPTGTLFTVSSPPAVSIGGIITQPAFAGLAPGFVGLYQVDVQVPAVVQPGNAVPVLLTAAGVSSNTATIAVQ